LYQPIEILFSIDDTPLQGSECYRTSTWLLTHPPLLKTTDSPYMAEERCTYSTSFFNIDNKAYKSRGLTVLRRFALALAAAASNIAQTLSLRTAIASDDVIICSKAR